MSFQWSVSKAGLIARLESLSFFSYWTRAPPARAEVTVGYRLSWGLAQGRNHSLLWQSVGSEEVEVDTSEWGFRFIILMHRICIYIFSHIYIFSQICYTLSDSLFYRKNRQEVWFNKHPRSHSQDQRKPNTWPNVVPCFLSPHFLPCSWPSYPNPSLFLSPQTYSILFLDPENPGSHAS